MHMCCVLSVVMLSCTVTCTKWYSNHVGNKVVVVFGLFLLVFFTQITQHQTFCSEDGRKILFCKNK